jgi:hypothetical protein
MDIQKALSEANEKFTLQDSYLTLLLEMLAKANVAYHQNTEANAAMKNIIGLLEAEIGKLKSDGLAVTEDDEKPKL